MTSEQTKSPLTEEDLVLRLSYFSRQCWHQRHLYSRQNAALLQRIANQDAQLVDANDRLRDAHDQLRDAHSRLQEVTGWLSQTFAQLQDAMAARIAAELKLAGYGLLEPDPLPDLDSEVKSAIPQKRTVGSPPLPGFHRAWTRTQADEHMNSDGGDGTP